MSRTGTSSNEQRQMQSRQRIRNTDSGSNLFTFIEALHDSAKKKVYCGLYKNTHLGWFSFEARSHTHTDTHKSFYLGAGGRGWRMRGAWMAKWLGVVWVGGWSNDFVWCPFYLPESSWAAAFSAWLPCCLATIILALPLWAFVCVWWSQDGAEWLS